MPCPGATSRTAWRHPASSGSWRVWCSPPCSARWRPARRAVDAGVWLAAAAVAVADGTNDGQKAMGVLAAGLSGVSAVQATGSGIAWWVRITCATVLAVGTVVGGRRLVQTVARGLAPAGPVDDLVAQVTSAGVIFAEALAGLPLSTSTVTTSARVGTGLAGRRRHVRWQGVMRILAMWVVTVPACGLLAAGLFELWRAAGG